LSCKSLNVCTRCCKDYILKGTKCYKECPIRTVNIKGECKVCSKDCLNCTTPTKCNKCEDSFLLNDKCGDCPDGMYGSKKKGTCEKCRKECLKCDD
jgi:hypothetical protein